MQNILVDSPFRSEMYNRYFIQVIYHQLVPPVKRYTLASLNHFKFQYFTIWGWEWVTLVTSFYHLYWNIEVTIFNPRNKKVIKVVVFFLETIKDISCYFASLSGSKVACQSLAIKLELVTLLLELIYTILSILQQFVLFNDIWVCGNKQAKLGNFLGSSVLNENNSY